MTGKESRCDAAAMPSGAIEPLLGAEVAAVERAASLQTQMHHLLHAAMADLEQEVPVSAQDWRADLELARLYQKLSRELDDRAGLLIARATNDCSWADVGEYLGVTKQAAHGQYRRYVTRYDAIGPRVSS